MLKSNRAGEICLKGMLMLLLLVSTACSGPKTTVLPEAKTAKIKQGEAAPFEGWILTDGAMAKILEAAERCQ